MKALPIKDGAFTVLLMFDCSAGDSERVASDLAEFVGARVRFHQGFVSSLIYLSEDALKVVKLFQWARAEDWEAFQASEDGRQAAQRLNGRRPTILYLETICATGAALPSESGEWRIIAS